MGGEPNLLGSLAVHYKLLTAEQLAESTRAQARSSERQQLGELWIDAGYLTRPQLEKLLAVQREVVAKQGGPAAAPPLQPSSPAIRRSMLSRSNASSPKFSTHV